MESDVAISFFLFVAIALLFTTLTFLGYPRFNNRSFTAVTSLISTILWLIIAYQSFHVEILSVYYNEANQTFVYDVYPVSFGTYSLLFMLLGLTMALRFIYDVLNMLENIGR